MRIISLNVNNFGGKCPKPLLKDYKIDDVTNWNECSSRHSFDGYNRDVEIQIEDIYLVGVHMNYKDDMWKSFYKLAKDISGKKALIIGDLNVFDDGTERKEVLKSLMNSYGWEDVWIYQGEASDTPTCDTEKRIDYVLAMKSFVVGGVREIIINDIRRQGISDHAAVVALL